MDDSKMRQENQAVVMHVDRRWRKDELSCEEIMKIVRQRAARPRRRVIDVE